MVLAGEKDSPELLILLWEDITALERQEKLSVMVTNRVKTPLATPVKAELGANLHQSPTASWVPPDDQTPVVTL